MKDEIIYRKATDNDISQMSWLITKTIGTCEISKSDLSINDEDIITINKNHLIEFLSNYFVAEIEGKIVGLFGISDVIDKEYYGMSLKSHREFLYGCVDEKYQGCGIGSKLFQMCCEHISDTMVCESWGKNDVNMKPILEKNGFFMAQDLGDDFYYNNGYCPYCCERGKGCNKCKAQIWVRWKR